MDEIGYMSFPGITTVEGGSYTASLGISPGVAVIQCRPQKQQPDKYGTLKIGFGNDKPIEFPDCVLDSARMQIDESGQVVTCYVLDRRWKWRFPVVSGVFNQYKPSGDLDTTTEKTPRELAERCLNAMGETGYDVSALPDDVRPEVSWDLANAAESLQSLCDQLGCVVALGLDNKVRVCVAGAGANLPDTDDIANVGYALDPAETPSAIHVVGEPDLFTYDCGLVPLAKELTGELIPVSEASYLPTGANAENTLSDWGDYEQFTSIDDEASRVAAYESVGRYYGIDWAWSKQDERAGYVQGISDSLKAAGVPFDIVDPLKQIELMPFQAYQDADGFDRPPLVHGVFSLYKDGLWENNIGDTSYSSKSMDEESTDQKIVAVKYQGGHSIDLKKHVVHFPRQMWRYSEDGSVRFCNWLWLRISFRVKDTDGQYFRTVGEKQLRPPAQSPRTSPVIVKADGVSVRYFPEPFGGPKRGTDNIAEVTPVLQEYADLVAKQFETIDARTVTYERIRPIALDGAIRSVTWSVGGGNTSQTVAMRNNETPRLLPSYKDRRFRQQTADVLKAFKQLNNQIRQANKMPAMQNLPFNS